MPAFEELDRLYLASFVIFGCRDALLAFFLVIVFHASQLGLQSVNRHECRLETLKLNALVLDISLLGVVFQLHEDEALVCRMRYRFNPEVRPEPQLTEYIGNDYVESERSRHLQPWLDHMLACLEGRLWERVNFAGSALQTGRLD